MELFNQFLPQKDIIIIIFSFLSDRNKKNLISTCKYMNSYKNTIFFNEQIRLNKIMYLNYYDQFTNIRASKTDVQQMKRCKKNFPNKMTDLELYDYRQCLYILLKNCNDLNHLVLNPDCRISNDKFQNLGQIKYLEWNIEQKIKKHLLPKNLLRFKIKNNHPDNYIPDTIEHLTVMNHYTSLTSIVHENLKILEIIDTFYFCQWSSPIVFYNLLKCLPNLEELVLWNMNYIDEIVKVLNTKYSSESKFKLVLDKKYTFHKYFGPCNFNIELRDLS